MRAIHEELIIALLAECLGNLCYGVIVVGVFQR